jgi:hypothetical protein
VYPVLFAVIVASDEFKESVPAVVVLNNVEEFTSHCPMYADAVVNFPVEASIVVMPDTAAKYSALENAPNANIRDLSDVTQYFYGGAYVPASKEYIFRISLHVSDLINRRLKQNKGLYLVSGLGGYLADRVVLSNTPNRKIRLRIIYTKI